MKIYTRGGDDGTTGLVSGERVPKHDPRVELYGTSDELNSLLGCVLSEIPSEGNTDLSMLRQNLVSQQNLLFEMGSELAGFVVAPGTSAILPDDVEFLEQCIDRYTLALAPMHSFVLPGGGRAASLLHVSRTVCRRLERLISAVMEATPSETGSTSARADTAEASLRIHPNILMYTNRLSDFLFVAARYANHAAGIVDTPWVSRARAAARVRGKDTEG